MACDDPRCPVSGRQVFVLLQFDPGMEYIPNRGTKVDLTKEDKS